MRALVFQGPRRLEVVDRDTPALGEHDALLEVRAVGICGSDVHGYAGESGRRQPGLVMGHEVSARVLELGPGVKGRRVGEHVTVNPVIGCGRCDLCGAGRNQLCARRTVIGVDASYGGAFAQYMAVPAENAIPVSEPLGEEAVLTEPMAVALHAVDVAGVQPADTVAVLGAGMIGLACAWAAVEAGAAAVFVTDVDSRKAARATAMGYHGVERADQSLAEALAARDLREVDRVIDAVGVSATVIEGLSAVRPGGSCCVVGMGAPELRIAAYPVITQERRIAGSYCYTRDDFTRARAVVEKHASRLACLIDAKVSLDEAPAVFERLATGATSSVKTVIQL